MRGIGLRIQLVTSIAILAFATGANAASISLVATLTGDQVTPPSSSPGSGTATFILDDVAGTLESDVSFSDLTSGLTSAHLHLGDFGVAGPIIRAYNISSVMGQTSGMFTDIFTGLTATQIGEIEGGHTYIDLHTTNFPRDPQGELRGQIVVPEPGSLTMVVLGTFGVLGYALCRRLHASPRAGAIQGRGWAG